MVRSIHEGPPNSRPRFALVLSASNCSAGSFPFTHADQSCGLVTGRTVFQHKDPLQVMIQHVCDVPRPLHVLDPAVPLPLSELVEACLAKDPAGRPPDGTALAETLDGV